MENNLEIHIHIPVESSQEESDAVNEAFNSDYISANVERSLVRMSADWSGLPMTIMISILTGIISNAIWDKIGSASKTALSDKRLKKRKTTIVIRRKDRNILMSEGSFGIQSSEKVIEFDSIEELIEYEKNHQEKS